MYLQYIRREFSRRHVPDECALELRLVAHRCVSHACTYIVTRVAADTIPRAVGARASPSLSLHLHVLAVLDGALDLRDDIGDVARQDVGGMLELLHFGHDLQLHLPAAAQGLLEARQDAEPLPGAR